MGLAGDGWVIGGGALVDRCWGGSGGGVVWSREFKGLGWMLILGLGVRKVAGGVKTKQAHRGESMSCSLKQRFSVAYLK